MDQGLDPEQKEQDILLYQCHQTTKFSVIHDRKKRWNILWALLKNCRTHVPLHRQPDADAWQQHLPFSYTERWAEQNQQNKPRNTISAVACSKLPSSTSQLIQDTMKQWFALALYNEMTQAKGFTQLRSLNTKRIKYLVLFLTEGLFSHISGLKHLVGHHLLRWRCLRGNIYIVQITP